VNSEEETAKRQARPMTKAPEGEGCPRCGGFVYAAEQMLARGRVSLLSLLTASSSLINT
jgi:hypothetical protein